LCRYGPVGDDKQLLLWDTRKPSSEVGMCTLNQVDPCPITYSLSNP
jgi:hypothetical protein